MKKKLILLFLLLSGLCASAQESTSAYNVLRLPVSAHVAALGGESNSVPDDDAALAQHNPALLADVTPRQFGLTVASLPDGALWAGAQYVHGFGLRHTASFFAQRISYGTMFATDEYGADLGQFTPSNVIVGAGYGYALSPRWAGGANLKTVYSRLGTMSAAALVADVGLNYYNKEEGWSWSAVLRNAGAEIKHFDRRTETVPYSLQMGFSKQLAHTPLRFNVTLIDLTRWSKAYYMPTADAELSAGRVFTNHLVVGVDWMPSPQVTLSAGYNFRRGYELTAAGRGHGAGFSFGAGVRFSRLRLDLAWARYHLASSSLMGSVSYRL